MLKKTISLLLILCSSALAGDLYYPNVTTIDSVDDAALGFGRQCYRMAVGNSRELLVSFGRASGTAGYELVTTDDYGATWNDESPIFIGTHGTYNTAPYCFGDSSFWISVNASAPNTTNDSDHVSIRQIDGVTLGVLDTVLISATINTGNRGQVFMAGNSLLFSFGMEGNPAVDTAQLRKTAAFGATATYTKVDSVLNVPPSEIAAPYYWDSKWQGLLYFHQTGTQGGRLMWIDSLTYDTFANATGGTVLLNNATSAWFNRQWHGWVKDSFGIIVEQVSVTDGADSVVLRAFHLSDSGGSGGAGVKDTVIWDDTTTILGHGSIPASYLAYACFSTVWGTDSVYLFYKYWADTTNYDSADIAYKISPDLGHTWGDQQILKAATNATYIWQLTCPPVLRKASNYYDIWAGWNMGDGTGQDSVGIYKLTKEPSATTTKRLFICN